MKLLETMASKSKKAQEQLAELEKLSAPFEDQLVEAAKFVGVDLETILRPLDTTIEDSTAAEPVQYFGREEWLLRWLLKKLAVPRKTASSWSLLSYLLKTIPVTNAAKILAERGFVSIVKLELEGLIKEGQESTKVSSKEDKKSSKKRKRSGEVVTSSVVQDSTELPRLLASIYAAVRFITDASEVHSDAGIDENGRGAAFSAEYMQKAIRTSPGEAAQVLGAWMTLCGKALPYLDDRSGIELWLSPFLRIWSCHTTDTTAYLSFSLHCTQPLLALLKAIKSGQYSSLQWTLQLVQLLARNIMNPAKSAMTADPESELLESLTKTSVLQDVSNAPHLFEVAIRSIKPHGSRRRRATDEAWLLHVFKTLKAGMPTKFSKNGRAISDMLQIAIGYKVMLDLPVLRAITLEFALPQDHVSWQLVATMIELDANVFLIPDKESENNLLHNLLARITKASISQEWPAISLHVVSEVVVPLMKEFAKARDLSGFMQHWHTQILEFEKLRAASEEPVITFSAWEDDALQVELRKLFEVSLTIQQIEQILEWLSSVVSSSPDAVCVLLDAISGSLVGETVIDAIGMRLYHIMFDDGASTKLSSRYKWRSLRIVSRTINVTTFSNVDKVLELWDQDFGPLVAQLGSAYPEGSELEFAEMARLACTIWSAPESGTLKDSTIKPVMLKLLKTISHLTGTLRSDWKGNDALKSEHNKHEKSNAWLLWSMVQCLFVEFPKTLILALELEERDLDALIHNVFWLCSAEAFPEVWLSALVGDEIMNCSKLSEKMVDVMLSNQTNHNNPIRASASTNTFSVEALLKVRMENLNKKQREAILKGWLPTGDVENDKKLGLSYVQALNPAILSLKLKMMEYAMFYEGMEFGEFTHLATALTDMDDPRKQASLALLKQLCGKTFEYVHTIPKETRNKAYISTAFKTIQKKIKRADEKSKHRLEYSFIAIFEVVLKVLLDTKVPILDGEDVQSVVNSFKTHLLGQLKTLLHDLRKGKAVDNQETQLTILSIVDALSTFGVDVSDIEKLRKDASKYTPSDIGDLSVGTQLQTFIFATVHGSTTEASSEVSIGTDLAGDVKTAYGRQSIVQKAKILANGDNDQKLALLKSIFGAEMGGLRCPDKLLAARQVIISLEDIGKSEDEASFDLSEAYTILSAHLPKMTSMVQLSIISETLQLMLQTKARSITQYNIDTTLGSISILCSRQGPSLNPSRANAIFTHLCHLFRSIILHHRLKLQGHMHLIVQTLLSLLRCLFRPLPHARLSTAKHSAPPPWLPTSSSPPSHFLTPQSAEAFTRLLTLLCDPSESSVRGKGHNILTNASEKWKRVTGWHMHFVLMEYVALQLEMRMESAVREKLVPGIYAVLDTGTVEGRRAVSSRLDSSQRAVFGGLVRDWGRFGKWKGA